MNLNLLRVFAAVVEHHSFSRAAETLDISQPAASKAVRELEAQLGTVLLDRQGRSFRVNEPGQRLYDYGRSIFALEREARDAVGAYAMLARGQLTVGASTTIATYWLPPCLVAFYRQHPDIELRLISANTQHITELLLDCRIDVALVEGGPVADPRFDIRPWRSEEMIIVAPRPPGSPGLADVTPHALADQVWIVRERGSGSREATDELLAKLGLAPPRTIEVGSNEAIVQTVAAGIGLGLVPQICARDQLTLGRVRQLPPGAAPFQRQLSRMRLPHRPVSPAALAFEAVISAGQPTCF